MIFFCKEQFGTASNRASYDYVQRLGWNSVRLQVQSIIIMKDAWPVPCSLDDDYMQYDDDDFVEEDEDQDEEDDWNMPWLAL
jgi:hypothetical protein